MSNSEAEKSNGAQSAPEGKFPQAPGPIVPGATIGILGSGQLGRMSAMAAKSMGYTVVIYDEVKDGPASSCADLTIVAPFDDRDALARFAMNTDVVTVEFENIPVEALEYLETRVPVRPSSSVVRICQDRVLEKEFLRNNGFPVAPFRVITSAAELATGIAELNAPSILKTAALGYDGKGQISLSPGDNTEVIWAMLGSPRAVLEQRISFDSEASVICARSADGETSCFPVQANIHRNGILDVTLAPAPLGETVAAKAREIATAITEKLGAIGLITVELFVLPDGSLMVNELAPRPHNSGHHTLETSMTSQFAQHVRAVCGLPLGPVELRSPGVMINLLGDLWSGGEPDWELLLREPGLFLHLYGKKGAKPGRKMGHATLLGEGCTARDRALLLRERIVRRGAR
ncbi:MAG: 5-(carboxyamino)imidazole ribonucleotide synthase [Chthoniobacterales bacterium]